MEANKIIKDVVVNIDLAPTIVEMAGGDLESVDGISFLPSLLGNRKDIDLVESNDIYTNPSFQQRGNLLLNIVITPINGFYSKRFAVLIVKTVL